MSLLLALLSIPAEGGLIFTVGLHTLRKFKNSDIKLKVTSGQVTTTREELDTLVLSLIQRDVTRKVGGTVSIGGRTGIKSVRVLFYNNTRSIIITI